jgi:hypothetical protein
MGYDIRCEDLARVFLSIESWATDREVAELAQEIQDAIEDYIEGTRPEDERAP